MNCYKIAEIKVKMEPKQCKTTNQAKKYLIPNNNDSDIILELPKEKIFNTHKKYPYLSLEDCEYMLLGSMYYEKLLDFNGCLLHASAIVYENNAYLFSADSGTGKSTHTSLWQDFFGKEKTFILNDDKPAIRKINNDFIVYGTPFSGKTNLNKNIGVPLKGICFIERSKTNWIKKIDSLEAFKLIIKQTVRPSSKNYMDKLLFFLNDLLQNTKFYKMGCNVSKEAVQLSYNTMKS